MHALSDSRRDGSVISSSRAAACLSGYGKTRAKRLTSLRWSLVVGRWPRSDRRTQLLNCMHAHLPLTDDLCTRHSALGAWRSLDFILCSLRAELAAVCDSVSWATFCPSTLSMASMTSYYIVVKYYTRSDRCFTSCYVTSGRTGAVPCGTVLNLHITLGLGYLSTVHTLQSLQSLRTLLFQGTLRFSSCRRGLRGARGAPCR